MSESIQKMSVDLKTFFMQKNSCKKRISTCI